ncbi:hypothetical protein TNCV_477251 [Trichonephila clavipes]|nr:hypothetical protein TNCV_477251 [Trichonephila clavipes]
MPDIKIDDNCLFEVERRLNAYLNSNKLEQLGNQHAEKLPATVKLSNVDWSAVTKRLGYTGLKYLQKGPISRVDLRKMIMKFQETGDLGVLPGRGWKPVGTESIEVATTMIERASSSINSSISGRSVSRDVVAWSISVR